MISETIESESLLDICCHWLVMEYPLARAARAPLPASLFLLAH